uniref:Uncharacterized protein n=1 Tax=Glossina palpalis gambiensis TaxID=67801 RepID=A0A1B0AUI4_9MUSC
MNAIALKYEINSVELKRWVTGIRPETGQEKGLSNAVATRAHLTPLSMGLQYGANVVSLKNRDSMTSDAYFPAQLPQTLLANFPYDSLVSIEQPRLLLLLLLSLLLLRLLLLPEHVIALLVGSDNDAHDDDDDDADDYYKEEMMSCCYCGTDDNDAVDVDTCYDQWHSSPLQHLYHMHKQTCQ